MLSPSRILFAQSRSLNTKWLDVVEVDNVDKLIDSLFCFVSMLVEGMRSVGRGSGLKMLPNDGRDEDAEEDELDEVVPDRDGDDKTGFLRGLLT